MLEREATSRTMPARTRVRALVAGRRRTLPASQPPVCLRALGGQDMPAGIDVGGVRFRHVRTFKHDFFAATGLYQGAGRQAIVKIGRRVGFLGLPLGWLGRRLSGHEAELLDRLAGQEGVPELLGLCGGDTVVRGYIPGHALRKGEQVGDEFFGRLWRIVAAMHHRGMAYVDLEKRQNVLVGDDGRPYLIDFQIGWPWPVGPLADTALGGWLRRRLQQGDLYHLRKLQRRCRPDQMTPQDLAASYDRPWPVRLHRRLTKPFTTFRRWVLSRVDPKRGDAERGADQHDPSPQTTG